MTYEFIYWFCLLLWVIGGVYINRADWQGWGRGSVLTFIMFLIIGLKLFGWPVKG